jgi:hypothetical protein
LGFSVAIVCSLLVSSLVAAFVAGEGVEPSVAGL